MSKVILVAVTMFATAVITVVVMRGAQPVQPEEAPVSSVQELMEGMIDPGARAIFESVGVIATMAGTEERQPRTDEEWAAVERQAAILAEGASLLKVTSRPIAPAGEPAAAAGEDGPELSTAQIEARRRDDRDAWLAHADAVRVVAVRARDAARARSVDGLYTVGGALQEACEACHQAFWYNAPPGVRIRR